MTRVGVWVGVLLGGLLAARNVGTILNALSVDGDGGGRRIGAGFGVIVGGILVGRVAGGIAGKALHRRLPTKILRGVDRAGGAALGAGGVLLVVWLVAPVLALIPAWPAEQAKGSVIVQTVDRFTPSPPSPLLDSLQIVDALGALPSVTPSIPGLGNIGDALGRPSPTLSGGANAGPEVLVVVAGGCPTEVVSAGVMVGRRRVLTTASAVRGTAAITLRKATVWVSQTEPSQAEGELSARVVSVDTVRDLAVIELPNGWVTPAAVVAGTGTGVAVVRPPFRQTGRAAAVSGPLRRAALSGSDGRRVRTLSVSLGSADVGAPVVDDSGGVVGVVRSVSPNEPTAEAIDGTEILTFLQRPPLGADRPPC